MQDITAVLPLLQTPKKIFITTHHRPDGDAMGSSLGLYHYLKNGGHHPVVVSPSEVPDFLLWMPGMEQVLNFETDSKKSMELLEECDLIFCLDFNRLDRIKLMEPALKAASQPKILIDHHLSPDTEAFQYGYSQPEKSSTCEMIYDLIRLANGSDKIDQNVMKCLYTGAVTDTGSFRFPATSASVHEMVASFKKRGFQHSEIHEAVFDAWSERRMRFLGFVLSERMEIYPDRGIGIIALSQADLDKFQAQTGDTEGIVNYPLSIREVTLAVLLIERKGEVKLSFRSKGDKDVRSLAHTYFGGGGHFNAAGGQSSDSLSHTIAKLKSVLGL